MFNKTFEENRNNQFVKVYKSNYSINEIVDFIVQGNSKIGSISISDNAEHDFKQFGGKYKLDDFYKIMEDYSFLIEDITIYFLDIPCVLTVYNDGTLSLLSKGYEIDISSIITEKKNTMKM